jgi:hypothetical protein
MPSTKRRPLRHVALLIESSRTAGRGMLQGVARYNRRGPKRCHEKVTKRSRKGHEKVPDTNGMDFSHNWLRPNELGHPAVTR